MKCLIATAVLCAAVVTATVMQSPLQPHRAVSGATMMTPMMYACAGSPWTVMMAPCAGGSAAWGTYNRTGNMTGWNVLTVESNGTMSDEQQAYGAGLIEGYGSAEDIVNFHHNTFGPIGSFAPVNDNIMDWLHSNDMWMQQQAAANKATSTEWAMIALLLDQVAGMIDGVNMNGFNYTRTQYMVSLAMPDVVSDLELVYGTSSGSKKANQHFTKGQRLHCSSIVKVTDDLSNILFGHVTWMQFNTMLRVYKMVTFHFTTVPLMANTISYSGYPGTIASTDDFYALSSGFGVMETSLSIFNMSLYDVLTPKSLLSSMRTMLANRLAKNGSHWADLFSFHNSGTYNNQWMVLDMNLFTPGQDLLPNTLWIVEQLPGLVDAADHTTILTFGYWPSYNIPFSKKVFDMAGFPSQLPAQVEWSDYQLACRAKLFRQLQGSIKDIPSIQHVLQYNQYQTDPLEKGNPAYAISSRYDLVPNPMGFGGLDCKVSSYNDWMNGTMKVHAFSGPTPQQKTFSFKTSLASELNPHQGLPETFDFEWQQYQP